MTVIRIKMEPEIRNMTMRRAQGEIEGIIARLNRFQQALASIFDAPIKTLATADAWFDETKPAATPIPKAREDKISGARYRAFPGLLHVSGKDLATLGAVYRYVGTLQPAAEPE